MRIALLAMMEPAAAREVKPRAYLRVAGATLAQHQLSLVLALGCQRVVCLARGTSPEIIALQHAAEGAGLQFAIVTAPRQLAGLVTAADELIVMGEGLLVDPAHALPLLDGRSPVVLVQPVEGALAAGFERIDINRAGAGILRVPGALVEKLHELPADCDVASALTRIALQSGVAMRDVPAAARSGTGWRLVRSEAEAYALESDWLRARSGEGATSPGRALARMAVVHFGSSLLHAGNASNMISVAVLALLALAGGLGWFGFVATGMVFVAGAWILAECSRLLRSAERHATGQQPPAIPRADALEWLIDAAYGLLVLAGTPHGIGNSIVGWLAAPAILMMLLALIPRVVRGMAATWVGDRLLVGLVLAVATASGQLLPVVQLASIALILLGYVMAAGSRS